jgi:hypothetical protein
MKNAKHNPKKLILHAETIRLLKHIAMRDLHQIKGGISPPSEDVATCSLMCDDTSA